MKLPEKPESTRAETEMEWAGVNSWTVSTEILEITGSVWRVLTAGPGGLMGQDLMIWVQPSRQSAGTFVAGEMRRVHLHGFWYW